jgi:hypothetical protein
MADGRRLAESARGIPVMRRSLKPGRRGRPIAAADGAGGPGFEHQADDKQRHPEREQRAAGQHGDAAAGDDVRRRTHNRAEQAGDGGRGQLGAAPGLRRRGRPGSPRADDAGGHRDLAHHYDGQDDGRWFTHVSAVGRCSGSRARTLGPDRAACAPERWAPKTGLGISAVQAHLRRAGKAARVRAHPLNRTFPAFVLPSGATGCRLRSEAWC